ADRGGSSSHLRRLVMGYANDGRCIASARKKCVNAMLIQHLLSFNTPGRGLMDISDAVDKLVADSEIQSGLSHIYIHHTSASLILCENADPQVRTDLEAFMRRLVPDGDRLFRHDEE